jgi:hypothetical protein
MLYRSLLCAAAAAAAVRLAMSGCAHHNIVVFLHIHLCNCQNMHRSLAVTFSVLVLMKHLFAPLAPIVAAYLVKAHCIECAQCNGSTCNGWPRLRFWHFLQLCLIAVIALLTAFLPFLVIVAPASRPAESLWQSAQSLELLTFEEGGGAQLLLLLPFVPAKCILDWEYSVGECWVLAPVMSCEHCLSDDVYLSVKKTTFECFISI